MEMKKAIRIRMYNVGFGDCFLLTLPDKRTVLVDAGFHSQGKGAFDANGLVDQIVKDVTDVGGEARIDVIVATHRHQDHVYAFNSDKWDELAVGEVWLPWMEDRCNHEATVLWKKQQHFAMNLAAAIPTFGLDDENRESVEFMLWNAGIDDFGFGVGGWSNVRALDCLHEGFARRDRTRPRFLPEKDVFPESFESPALPGVRIHVLGPARDPKLIEDLDPEADGETYRALALRRAPAAPMLGGDGTDAPFGEDWRVTADELRVAVSQAGAPPPPLSLDETQHINDLAHSADAVLAAEKVDSMINSTSLVLMLEIGKARLLLAGDAEWGTWKRILEDEEARTLLRGATFFKVGHHGSHNATAKTLVEKILPRGIPAMISTQQGPNPYRNNIPLPELLTALTERGISYVRSDEGGGQLPQGFKEGAKWIDLELPC
jgi:beta-lactamase superfamily II metal-dependent hydrolase